MNKDKQTKCGIKIYLILHWNTVNKIYLKENEIGLNIKLLNLGKLYNNIIYKYNNSYFYFKYYMRLDLIYFFYLKLN